MAGSYLKSTDCSHVTCKTVEGQSLHDNFRSVRSIVSKSLPEAADLLAQPSLNQRKNEIDWFAPFAGPVVPLASLSKEEAQAHMQSFEKIVNSLKLAAQQLADKKELKSSEILKGVSSLDPQGNNFFLVGGKPVVAGWGLTNPEGEVVVSEPLVFQGHEKRNNGLNAVSAQMPGRGQGDSRLVTPPSGASGLSDSVPVAKLFGEDSQKKEDKKPEARQPAPAAPFAPASEPDPAAPSDRKSEPDPLKEPINRGPVNSNSEKSVIEKRTIFGIDLASLIKSLLWALLFLFAALLLCYFFWNLDWGRGGAVKETVVPQTVRQTAAVPQTHTVNPGLKNERTRAEEASKASKFFGLRSIGFKSGLFNESGSPLRLTISLNQSTGPIAQLNDGKQTCMSPVSVESSSATEALVMRIASFKCPNGDTYEAFNVGCAKKGDVYSCMGQNKEVSWEITPEIQK